MKIVSPFPPEKLGKIMTALGWEVSKQEEHLAESKALFRAEVSKII